MGNTVSISRDSERHLLAHLISLSVLLFSPTVVFATEVGKRPTAESCLRFFDPHVNVQRFIVNFCRQTVYVSVVEFHAHDTTKHCAVYGLLGRRYGKQYSLGEIYLRNSLLASYNVDRALENCKRSGYEMSGEGLGTFMRIVDD